jgi:hypothetical protein
MDPQYTQLQWFTAGTPHAKGALNDFRSSKLQLRLRARISLEFTSPLQAHGYGKNP